MKLKRVIAGVLMFCAYSALALSPTFADQTTVVAGNSAPRIVAQAVSVNVSPSPSPTPTPATTQPGWVAQIITDTTRAQQQALTGDAVPGNTVSRIAGYSAIPMPCADCSSRPWLTQSRTCRYTAQVIDAIAVAAAVRGGKNERIGFGNRPNPLAYMVALGAEDYIVDNIIGPNNTHVQMAANYAMCGASVFNAIKSITNSKK